MYWRILYQKMLKIKSITFNYQDFYQRLLRNSIFVVKKEEIDVLLYFLIVK